MSDEIKLIEPTNWGLVIPIDLDSDLENIVNQINGHPAYGEICNSILQVQIIRELRRINDRLGWMS
jgi:hypothetical protein